MRHVEMFHRPRHGHIQELRLGGNFPALSPQHVPARAIPELNADGAARHAVVDDVPGFRHRESPFAAPRCRGADERVRDDCSEGLLDTLNELPGLERVRPQRSWRTVLSYASSAPADQPSRLAGAAAAMGGVDQLPGPPLRLCIRHRCAPSSLRVRRAPQEGPFVPDREQTGLLRGLRGACPAAAASSGSREIRQAPAPTATRRRSTNTERP